MRKKVKSWCQHVLHKDTAETGDDSSLGASLSRASMFCFKGENPQLQRDSGIMWHKPAPAPPPQPWVCSSLAAEAVDFVRIDSAGACIWRRMPEHSLLDWG